MLNRLFLVLFVFLGLASCEQLMFNKKKNISVNKKIEPIDFKSIDAYPLLPECENLESRTLQKACFYQSLAKRIESSLNDASISLSKSFKDTIQVSIQINSEGFFSLKSVKKTAGLDVVEFSKQMDKIIGKLPQIQPAIKSGIPVNSEFILPISFNTE